MRRVWATAVESFAAALLVAPGARGDDPAALGIAAARAETYAGASSCDDGQGALAFGADVLGQYAVGGGAYLVGGALGEVLCQGASGPGRVVSGFAGAFGIGRHEASWGVDLLGVAGRRKHARAGSSGGPFGGNPGTDGDATYAGLRGGPMARFGGRVRFVLGLCAFADTDLVRHDVTYEYTVGFLGPPERRTGQATIGTFDLGVVLRLGAEVGP